LADAAAKRQQEQQESVWFEIDFDQSGFGAEEIQEPADIEVDLTIYL
jgi:hypothetical protein